MQLTQSKRDNILQASQMICDLWVQAQNRRAKRWLKRIHLRLLEQL